MEENNSYFSNLLKNSKAARKQVSLYLDDSKIERIDIIVKLFSSISDSKSFSRNTLIEEAIDKFLDESDKFLQEEHGINVNELLEEERSKKYDTVILAANGRGFEETFLGEEEDACWYPCRISDKREAGLKYIAIYRGTPVSAITHYAKIREFVYDKQRNCKVCHFDGSAIELPNEIKLGSKDKCFFVGTKYTSLEFLLNAAKADEIIFR